MNELVFVTQEADGGCVAEALAERQAGVDGWETACAIAGPLENWSADDVRF